MNKVTPKRRKTDFYQDILSSIQDGIIVISKGYIISEFNPSAENIFDISYTAAINRDIRTVIQNIHIIQLIERVFSSGNSYSETEHKIFSPKRVCEVPLSISISPLYDKNGGIEGAVIILKDLTILKEHESHKVLAEKLAYTGIVAAGMAHEIKNPLGGIKGASQLLRSDLKGSPHSEYIDVILKGIERIDHIVSELLSLSKGRGDNFNMINIHEVIEDIIYTQKKGALWKDITIHPNYDPSIPLIEADENRMFQMLLNILKNAVEAMEEHGDIFITSRVSLDYHLISKKDRRPTQMILVEIKDTGCGIPDETTGDIFTPFFTTKTGGYGLGLIVVTQIIEEHKGSIKIFNNPAGRGTTVQIYLPVRQ